MDLDLLQRALDDIHEWFTDAGLEVIVANLAPGATTQAIDERAAALGVALPPALRWLYAQHDGQRDLDVYPLFGPLSFLPLSRISAARAGMRESYFGMDSGADADAAATRKAVFDDRAAPLRADELDGRWLPFANTEGDFLAVHGGSGRVIEIRKGDLPAIRVVAEDVETYLQDYADALWNDNYAIAGDPQEPGVQEEGMHCLRAYAQPL